jgi:hypothetical protein
MTAIRVGVAIAAALVLVSSACGEVKSKPDAAIDASPDAAPDAGVDPRQTVVELPQTPNRDFDLLFVVDDSPSMLDKQLNLRNNFPRFVNVLSALPGGLPNLHIGVVTTDMGTKASGSPTPGPAIGQIGQGGCSNTGKSGNLQIGTAAADLNGVFISDIKQTDGTRLTNYNGDLATVFGKLASVGAGGCGFEQPLAAMRAALNNNPANAGFIRPAAVLGVMFLADEDDCSAKSTTIFGPESVTLGPLQSFRCTRFGVTCAGGGQTSDAMNQIGAKTGCAANATSDLVDAVAPYQDFLRALKPDPRRVAVTAIFGPAEPFAVELRAPPGGGSPQLALAHSCSYQGSMSTEVADPAVRLRTFLAGFPDRSASTTICQQDLTGGLGQLAELLRRSVGDPCVLDPLADTDLNAAGLQPDCVVEDLAGASATVIPPCAASPGAQPCWRLVADAATCTGFMNLKLVVDRTVAPDPATTTRMRCLVAP